MPVADALEVEPRLLQREARLQPRDGREVADVAIGLRVRHRQRRGWHRLVRQHPDLRAFREPGARPEDSGDRARLAVDAHARADGVRAAARQLLPGVVAEHDQPLARHEVARAGEHPARGRRQAEHVEEIGVT